MFFSEKCLDMFFSKVIKLEDKQLETFSGRRDSMLFKSRSIPGVALVKYYRLIDWKEEVPAYFPEDELMEERQFQPHISSQFEKVLFGFKDQTCTICNILVRHCNTQQSKEEHLPTCIILVYQKRAICDVLLIVIVLFCLTN